MSIAELHGTPMALAQAAVAERSSDLRGARRGRGDAYDYYWCVFDVDAHPNLAEAVALATQNGVEVGLSNPCVELWFLLHFCDQFAYIERHDAQRRCRDLLNCEKHLTSDALSRLEASYDEAVSRARRLDEKHRGDGSPPLSNPSSSLWRLVELIRGQ